MKQISNPFLVGAMELMKQEDTREHRETFLRALVQAKFLSPVTVTPRPVPDENGRVSFAEGTQVQFPMLTTTDGRKVFMAFTDSRELHKWTKDPDQQVLVQKFADYATMLLGAGGSGKEDCPAVGFAIDPCGGNIVIPKELVAEIVAQNRNTKKEEKDSN